MKIKEGQQLQPENWYYGIEIFRDPARLGKRVRIYCFKFIKYSAYGAIWMPKINYIGFIWSFGYIFHINFKIYK